MKCSTCRKAITNLASAYAKDCRRKQGHVLSVSDWIALKVLDMLGEQDAVN